MTFWILLNVIRRLLFVQYSSNQGCIFFQTIKDERRCKKLKIIESSLVRQERMNTKWGIYGEMDVLLSHTPEHITFLLSVLLFSVSAEKHSFLKTQPKCPFSFLVKLCLTPDSPLTI